MNTDYVSLILFVLATIGMTHIIVDGSIMQWFRDLVKNGSQWLSEKTHRPGFAKLGGVVDCYLCCGTWCGFFMALVFLTYNPFKVLACGCAGGFLANLAAVLLNWIEAATIVNLPPQQENNQDEH
jgi:hypothetical protein